MSFQRDAFITTLFDAAKRDKDIFFISADFGAPALDQFRAELPEQFIHCGISEQNMIDLAAGLALDGRKVFCYAMAPFVTLRCLEQHKCSSAIMDLPVCTIVAGVGLGYADAGPTHYATEDVACLRAIVKSTVLTASDAEVAKLLAADAIAKPKFSFIRLDRQALKTIEPVATAEDVARGWRSIGKGKTLAIVTSGYMLTKTLAALEGNHHASDVTVFDMIRVKPLPDSLIAALKQFDVILSIEEQTPAGASYGALLEGLADHGVVKPVAKMCLPERYFFENGGRDRLLSLAGLSEGHINTKIHQLLH